MASLDVDASPCPEEANYEVAPLDKAASECKEGKQEEEDEEEAAPRRGRFTVDEKRAGLIVLGCFLFQEVHSSALRTMLVASIAAYAVSKYFATSPVTSPSFKSG
ncbi:uncharacterized protein Tco025E_03599 [Trypanosoma conorhini]|uniref:Uncharacterized protein n=1 Tax=Trypanosoma conorhini TaxID=83891 RepID=A0A3R7LD19_9TRYP|nr:uncharacterized protein Tco025E_03599 [Trypanosoma conorhini]RNF21156.1 hypothetical protein Tco025E_03599 [Trypanosoma conorhini]